MYLLPYYAYKQSFVLSVHFVTLCEKLESTFIGSRSLRARFTKEFPLRLHEANVGCTYFTKFWLSLPQNNSMEIGTHKYF